MIIIINGTGGSGKDTFVSYCADYAKVFNISAVDVVKEAARVLGWEGEKSETARKMLADMKQISINYNDGPTKYIMAKAEEFHNSENIVFVGLENRECMKRRATSCIVDGDAEVFCFHSRIRRCASSKGNDALVADGRRRAGGTLRPCLTVFTCLDGEALHALSQFDVFHQHDIV